MSEHWWKFIPVGFAVSTLDEPRPCDDHEGPLFLAPLTKRALYPDDGGAPIALCDSCYRQRCEQQEREAS